MRAARSYALTKQSRFRVRKIFLSRQLLNIQRSLSALREAGKLPRCARIKWRAGTPDAPLQVPSGTESMLMNAGTPRSRAFMPAHQTLGVTALHEEKWC